MSELKKLEPLSDWIEYELDTKQIDPPILKLRLRYLEDADAFVPLTPMERFNKAVDLIAEWDITVDGQPLSLTDKTGRDQLTDFLVRKVVGRGIILGVAVVADAQDRENFLKN
ncbi:MAG TPA: hypothetical protein VNA25_25905 [Phycisphaerae bacterium]|nr:hypothetical protein [Phycisphaerae bacterium]